MPIDYAVFIREMTVLGERFGRALSDRVLLGYHEHLDALLSTDEFCAACRALFASETFWPPPARFVEQVRGNPSDMAQLEWMRVVRAVANNTPLEGVSPAGREALAAIGGSWALRAGESGISHLRRDFVAAYSVSVSRLADGAVGAVTRGGPTTKQQEALRQGAGELPSSAAARGSSPATPYPSGADDSTRPSSQAGDTGD